LKRLQEIRETEKKNKNKNENKDIVKFKKDVNETSEKNEKEIVLPLNNENGNLKKFRQDRKKQEKNLLKMLN